MDEDTVAWEPSWLELPYASEDEADPSAVTWGFGLRGVQLNTRRPNWGVLLYIPGVSRGDVDALWRAFQDPRSSLRVEGRRSTRPARNGPPSLWLTPKPRRIDWEEAP